MTFPQKASALSVTGNDLVSGDVLDLYETLASAGYDIKTAAEHIYVWRYSGVSFDQQIASARAAAERVLLAVTEWERGQ